MHQTSYDTDNRSDTPRIWFVGIFNRRFNDFASCRLSLEFVQIRPCRFFANTEPAIAITIIASSASEKRCNMQKLPLTAMLLSLLHSETVSLANQRLSLSLTSS